jgi:hypothetical protein
MCCIAAFHPHEDIETAMGLRVDFMSVKIDQDLVHMLLIEGEKS